MVRPRPRPALWLAATLLVLAADAHAQSPGATLTVVGGWSREGDLTPGLTPTVLKPGALTGIQLDLYPGGGALGIRFEGFYSRRALKDEIDEYGLATANLGVTLRTLPIEAFADLQPYVAVLGGGTMYRAVGGAADFGAGAFGSDPVYRVHASAALGFDLPLTYRFGLRLEGGDKVIFPSVGRSPTTQGFPTVHTPVFALGVQYRLGMPPTRRTLRGPRVSAEPEPVEVAAVDTISAAGDTAAVVETAEAEPVPGGEAEAPGAAAFTVQVRDFLGRSTARRWAERAQILGLPAWSVDVEIGGTPASRLRIGAAATAEEARQLATAVQQQLGWTVTVESITTDDPVPANAVERTQEFLSGS